MGKSRLSPSQILAEPIRYHSDYQKNWPALIPALKRDKYIVESTSTLSIQGDAPKCFLRVKEYIRGRRMSKPRSWPKFIAKVGSKWYPIESITEHLITRLGQSMGFDVADSRLRMVGQEVRFMSRYFLRGQESLTHGLEIFREDHGDEIVEEIAKNRLERDFYIFPTVIVSIRKSYPQEGDEIILAFLRMLLFDSIVGNNDRHPANWGVITSPKQSVRSRFSPIFDTARGLFWNSDETFVQSRLKDKHLLRGYVNKSRPQVGWDGEQPDHFQLLARIVQHYPEYADLLREKVGSLSLDDSRRMLEEEFGLLLSAYRLDLIQKCLEMRMEEIKKVFIV